jgi:hypothetical protein
MVSTFNLIFALDLCFCFGRQFAFQADETLEMLYSGCSGLIETGFHKQK